jgi:large subunit ribosomal protein L14
MIQVQTWVKTMDNSGARHAECIKPLGGFNRTMSYTGECILVSIKRLRLLRKVKVGQIYTGLITRTKKTTRYRDGSSNKNEKNVIIMMTKKYRIIATRFFGWVSRKLRRKKYMRVLILCGKWVL